MCALRATITTRTSWWIWYRSSQFPVSTRMSSTATIIAKFAVNLSQSQRLRDDCQRQSCMKMNMWLPHPTLNVVVSCAKLVLSTARATLTSLRLNQYKWVLWHYMNGTLSILENQARLKFVKICMCKKSSVKKTSNTFWEYYSSSKREQNKNAFNFHGKMVIWNWKPLQI